MKRVYRMQSRADRVEQTRMRILEAAYRLLLERHYDEVSLERVAECAGLTKQTVIRQFRSKDQLAYAVVDWQRPLEEAARLVASGDVRGAVKTLVERYERMGDANVRVLQLEKAARRSISPRHSCRSTCVTSARSSMIRNGPNRGMRRGRTGTTIPWCS